MVNDFDINLTFLHSPPATPSPQRRATRHPLPPDASCSDWRTYGFAVTKLGLQGSTRSSSPVQQLVLIWPFFAAFLLHSTPHGCRVLCSAWCPCLLEAEFRLWLCLRCHAQFTSSGQTTQTLLVMNNWFAGRHEIKEKFDLKGSTHGRKASKAELVQCRRHQFDPPVFARYHRRRRHSAVSRGLQRAARCFVLMVGVLSALL